MTRTAFSRLFARAIVLMVVAITSLSLMGCERYGLGDDPALKGITPRPAGINPLDGRWSGYITWNDYTPVTLERQGNELFCVSSNGLPIRVGLDLVLTPSDDGGGTATARIGGASCLVDEDREDNLTSTWMDDPEYTSDFGGPMTWKGRTLEITLPGGQVLRGELPPDVLSTIDGTITTTMTKGTLVGEWFANQQ